MTRTKEHKTMLEVRDLHCSYGTTQVLKGVDITVNNFGQKWFRQNNTAALHQLFAESRQRHHPL